MAVVHFQGALEHGSRAPEIALRLLPSGVLGPCCGLPPADAPELVLKGLAFARAVLGELLGVGDDARGRAEVALELDLLGLAEDLLGGDLARGRGLVLDAHGARQVVVWRGAASCAAARAGVRRRHRVARRWSSLRAGARGCCSKREPRPTPHGRAALAAVCSRSVCVPVWRARAGRSSVGKGSAKQRGRARRVLSLCVCCAALPWCCWCVARVGQKRAFQRCCVRSVCETASGLEGEKKGRRGKENIEGLEDKSECRHAPQAQHRSRLTPTTQSHTQHSRPPTRAPPSIAPTTRALPLAPLRTGRRHPPSRERLPLPHQHAPSVQHTTRIP
jgi:hypothetical protein